jgi:Rrf2 family protein
VRISAKADYAVRAVVELAASPANKPMRAEQVARTQEIPLNFLENILGELRHAGILRSQRGPDGGFRLAKAADQISIADVIRAVEGPLATVRGGPPEESSYPGAAEDLPKVWIAVRKSLRSVMEEVSVADVASRRLPRAIAKLSEDPEAWLSR